MKKGDVVRQRGAYGAGRPLVVDGFVLDAMQRWYAAVSQLLPDGTVGAGVLDLSCPTCGGEGTVDVSCSCHGHSPQFECGRCGNSGYVGRKCEDCGGSGERKL